MRVHVASLLEDNGCACPTFRRDGLRRHACYPMYLDMDRPPLTSIGAFTAPDEALCGKDVLMESGAAAAPPGEPSPTYAGPLRAPREQFMASEADLALTSLRPAAADHAGATGSPSVFATTMRAFTLTRPSRIAHERTFGWYAPTAHSSASAA